MEPSSDLSSFNRSSISGPAKHWVTKQESVEISDLERTIIDGLRQPEYCGGVTEVAKGLWMRHQDMQVTKLVDYALRLGIGAVIRRLGYLLELYRIAPENELARLRNALTATYLPLDPDATEGRAAFAPLASSTQYHSRRNSKPCGAT